MAHVYSDGDLRVNVESKTWTFNPLCVTAAPQGAEYNATVRSSERLDHGTETTGPSGGECCLWCVSMMGVCWWGMKGDCFVSSGSPCIDVTMMNTDVEAGIEITL